MLATRVGRVGEQLLVLRLWLLVGLDGMLCGTCSERLLVIFCELLGIMGELLTAGALGELLTTETIGGLFLGICDKLLVIFKELLVIMGELLMTGSVLRLGTCGDMLLGTLGELRVTKGAGTSDSGEFRNAWGSWLCARTALLATGGGVRTIGALWGTGGSCLSISNHWLIDASRVEVCWLGV